MNILRSPLIYLLAIIICGCTAIGKYPANRYDYLAGSQNIKPMKIPEDQEYLKLKMENYYPIPKVPEGAKQQKNIYPEKLLMPPK